MESVGEIICVRTLSLLYTYRVEFARQQKAPIRRSTLFGGCTDNEDYLFIIDTILDIDIVVGHRAIFSDRVSIEFYSNSIHVKYKNQKTNMVIINNSITPKAIKTEVVTPFVLSM